ncbi:hypothetical protein A2Z22_03670 [Candidatus Woesebacteria bacterium RBG_16_34_12]|uniref:Uncharacterized protein n=1 Tax=Candidatus Woesebacteria bacterium RBG_16_34_12 TaxID=1802480 RepID=A0A1F7X7K7_9BACT|nr:MAG: hypothetical protein A2Z22_03670 [Candidatus Woesebacteria bacterium RBG_16_34_12]
MTLHKISKEMGIKEDDIVTGGIRTFIRSELGKIEAQLYCLYRKYGITSTADLEHKIEKGTVVESDVFEDLTRIDYLEAEKNKLQRLIKTI